MHLLQLMIVYSIINNFFLILLNLFVEFGKRYVDLELSRFIFLLFFFFFLCHIKMRF